MGMALAQPADGSHEQKNRLAEQKLKLVEMLIEAPATKARLSNGDPATVNLIEQSKKLTSQAREAIAGQQYDAATRILDEALRGVFKTSNQPAPPQAESDSALQKQFQDLAEQISGYRNSLQDLLKDKRNSDAASKLMARIDKLTDEGRKLHSTGKLVESNRKMTEAYKLAVAEIAELRAGQEVIMKLQFETPADEFAYELKRYQSNEMLVRMMVSDGKAEGERGPMVDNFIAEAARLNSEARRISQSGDHKTGIATMEKANAQLNRALQAMGVPVF